MICLHFLIHREEYRCPPHLPTVTLPSGGSEDEEATPLFSYRDDNPRGFRLWCLQAATTTAAPGDLQAGMRADLYARSLLPAGPLLPTRRPMRGASFVTCATRLR